MQEKSKGLILQPNLDYDSRILHVIALYSPLSSLVPPKVNLSVSTRFLWFLIGHLRRN